MPANALFSDTESGRKPDVGAANRSGAYFKLEDYVDLYGKALIGQKYLWEFPATIIEKKSD